MIARYARVTVSKCNKTNEYRVFDPPPPLRRGLKTSLPVLVSGRSFAFSGEEEKKFVGESTIERPLSSPRQPNSILLKLVVN